MTRVPTATAFLIHSRLLALPYLLGHRVFYLDDVTIEMQLDLAQVCAAEGTGSIE